MGPVLHMRLFLCKTFVSRNGVLTRLLLYIGPLQTHQEDNAILGLLKSLERQLDFRSSMPHRDILCSPIFYVARMALNSLCSLGRP